MFHTKEGREAGDVVLIYHFILQDKFDLVDKLNTFNTLSILMRHDILQ